VADKPVIKWGETQRLQLREFARLQPRSQDLKSQLILALGERDAYRSDLERAERRESVLKKALTRIANIEEEAESVSSLAEPSTISWLLRRAQQLAKSVRWGKKEKS